MVRPSKVAAFLSPLSGAWDPSLMLVMGGALAIATPAYQAVMHSWGGGQQAPLLGGEYSFPTKSQLDAQLLAGASMFGAGWGMGGMCPGPGIVAGVHQAAPQVLGFLGAMLGGMALEQVTPGVK